MRTGEENIIIDLIPNLCPRREELKEEFQKKFTALDGRD